MAERNLARWFQAGRQLLAGAIGICVGNFARDLFGLPVAFVLAALCGFAGIVICETVLHRSRGPRG